MIVNSVLANLGDNLWLTPLFKNKFANKLILPDDVKSRELAPIFNGIAEEISFGHSASHAPKAQGKIHYALAHLKYFNLETSCIPYVVISDEELSIAKRFLQGINNPVAVNFTTSNKGSDPCSRRRVMTEEQANLVSKTLIKNNFTPVNLGISSNTDQIKRVINILDLDIRMTAACYKFIGKYIGTESGTSNLMIAAGGKAVIYHPDFDEVMYPGWHFHFTEEYWTDEKCRAKYFNFSEMGQIENHITFLNND